MARCRVTIVCCQGGRVLDPANALDGFYDIGILHGQIEAVAPALDSASADAVFDMTGKWVMPGHIDTHVHVASSLAGLRHGQ